MAVLPSLFGGLFIGLTLTAITYIFGFNSLAMFNPAVTIGHLIRNSETFGYRDIDQWMTYLVVQFLGALGGGFFAGVTGGKAAGYMYTFINYPVYELKEAYFGEMLFTFILVSVHIHTATDKRIKGNQFYGIAIGAVLAVAAVALGPITMCSINPAVWFGTLMSAWYFLDDDGLNLTNSKYTWIYPAAQLSAAILAGLWYNLVYGGPEADGFDPKEAKQHIHVRVHESRDASIRREKAYDWDESQSLSNLSNLYERQI